MKRYRGRGRRNGSSGKGTGLFHQKAPRPKWQGGKEDNRYQQSNANGKVNVKSNTSPLTISNSKPPAKKVARETAERSIQPEKTKENTQTKNDKNEDATKTGTRKVVWRNSKVVASTMPIQNALPKLPQYFALLDHEENKKMIGLDSNSINNNLPSNLEGENMDTKTHTSDDSSDVETDAIASCSSSKPEGETISILQSNDAPSSCLKDVFANQNEAATQITVGSEVEMNASQAQEPYSNSNSAPQEKITNASKLRREKILETIKQYLTPEKEESSVRKYGSSFGIKGLSLPARSQSKVISPLNSWFLLGGKPDFRPTAMREKESEQNNPYHHNQEQEISKSPQFSPSKLRLNPVVSVREKRKGECLKSYQDLSSCLESEISDSISFQKRLSSILKKPKLDEVGGGTERT